MPGGPLKTAVRQIKRVLSAPAGDTWSDRQLLQRFSREGDEAAFACLVRRHAALVLGVSRRVLGHAQDAEDVFQASFLILARKAGSRSWQPSIAGWLYRVAYRLAQRARARIARRRNLERQAEALRQGKPSEERGEWYTALDEELQRLGDAYRGPLVLCYLEGKTRDQAARHLGWSLRTLQRRLEQGLKLLRPRLTRRGHELPAALLTAGLSQQAASAAVAAPALETTIQAAVAFSSGNLHAAALSTNTLTLAQQAMRALAMTKLKIGLMLFLMAGLLAAGLGGLAYGLIATEPPQQAQAAPNPPATTPLPTTWPEGATVTGRVVNHKGEAVANAEVLLLGPERILVDDNKAWFVFEGDRALRPPSARTNERGEFRIQRLKGKADRLAVISADPLLWVVARKSLPRAGEIEIKLPPSGSLAIHCDLPGKTAQQPVMIELRTFDGVAWDTDMLRFHSAEHSAPNPGERVFKHLPPAIYAVERDQQVKTADSVEMHLADRQLVKVDSHKTAAIRFQHKVGRPLSGQVRGLEKVDLRYATVSIDYAGPEERDRNGKSFRRMTTFDAMTINSDGHFKTDPIPPGKYMLHVFAVSSSTPRQSTQDADYRAQVDFTLPEHGEPPRLVVVAKANTDPRPPLTDCRVRVVDEMGKPLSKVQVMLHTADAGYHSWTESGLGVATFPDPEPFARTEAADVLLRADGYVSAVAHFERKQREQLRQGQHTITLKRGEKVELRFRLPEGLTWPKGVLPDAYFKEMEARVQMMRQPANRKQPSDFNMLNLHELDPGRFELRLAPDTPPFFVGIHAPGFLQFFDTGPFTLADFKQSVLTIDVPRPASLDVRFDPESRNAEALSFKSAWLEVMRQVEGDSYLQVANTSGATIKQELKLTDLSPGHYYVSMGTQPRSEGTKVPGTAIDLGSYHDRKELDLQAGQSGQVRFGYVPFDARAFRGRRTAVVRIRMPDGAPARGRQLEVSYFDGHYGQLVVFSGLLPDSGEVTLKDITDRITFEPNRSYFVTVDNKQIGNFGFTKDQATETFEFHLAPQAGDLAPDVELHRVVDGKGIRLSELRGKVVCLEFWATWCGPCQPAMAKLNELAQEQAAAWKNRVLVLPVSIDTKMERVRSHVTQRGWQRLEHHWAGNATSTWDAPAAHAFVIRGVPETILIGRDGRILWRGHPGDNTGGQDLRSRIEAALAR